MITLKILDLTTLKTFTIDLSPLSKARTFMIRCVHGNKLRIQEYQCDTPEEYAQCYYWYSRQELNKK